MSGLKLLSNSEQLMIVVFMIIILVSFGVSVYEIIPIAIAIVGLQFVVNWLFPDGESK